MPGHRELRIVAVTGERLAGLAPYVPALDDEGAVVFQARLTSGGSTVVRVRGGESEELVDPGAVEVVSHPDGAPGTAVAFYATLPDGTGAVCAVAEAGLQVLAGVEDGLVSVGPAGPTANAQGLVALRADCVDGPAALVVDASGLRRVASAADGFVACHGLPVLDAHGAVLVRASRADGVEGVYRRAGETLEVVAETGRTFTALGRFPCTSPGGAIAFAAATVDEGSAVVRVTPAGRAAIVDAEGRFASFRGALVADDGHVVRLATPVGGALGLFDGPDPEADRILGIGDGLLGSTVVELAANPVSIDARGDVAIRVALADGREAVVVAPRSER